MPSETCCQNAPNDPSARVCDRGAISVVIPARNAEATIGRTLRSLAPDRDLLREILLIDDGSDDATAHVAHATADRFQLPLTLYPIHAGSAGAARNAGIERAAGDYIFYLDADDEVLAGGLGLLHQQLRNSPSHGVAIGSSIRRTEGRADLLKKPEGYGKNCQENVCAYLTNRMWPIAMGSALVRKSAVADLRFPTAPDLDEDTCYWAAVLARTNAITISDPVLLYMLDELRMSDRFTRSPARTLLTISRELNNLQRFGIGREVLQWRKAWIALRITRQLLMRRQFADAYRTLRVVRSHPDFRWSWRVFRYSVRIRIGKLKQVFQRTPAIPPAMDYPVARGSLRTLVLTADPAAPPVSGAELRNWQNACTASHFGPVLLASVRLNGAQPDVEKGNIQIVAISEPGQPRGRSLAKRRTSIDIRIPRSAAKRLVEIVRRFRPHTVIVEGLPLFPLLKYLRPLSPQLILDMHNVESYLSAQMPHTEKRPALFRYGPDDPTRLRRLERKAISIVDRLWVCSRHDEDRIRRVVRVGIPVEVVPNGIPRFSAPHELPAYPSMQRGAPIILFVGHLGYSPNVDAATRLACEILPRVRQHVSGARLILAGRFPQPAVAALTNIHGVSLIANPQDITSLLCCAHLAAIPLRWGGGTRLKILEAMAWGLPVVASPKAAEGLDLVDEHEFLMAETDEEFAERIIALTNDRQRSEILRRTAHAKVLRLYGPDAIELAVHRGLGTCLAAA